MNDATPEAAAAIQLLSYPARPANGGRLGLVAKPGLHLWSAKLNGWRAPVHAPTGDIWNRLGQRLAISDEFNAALKDLGRSRFAWLDCEALERRHRVGQGSLILLDVIMPNEPALDRYDSLLAEAARLGWPLLRIGDQPEPCRVYLLEQTALTETSPADNLRLAAQWNAMQGLNQRWGAPFYEGLVAKRADSTYPIQLRDPKAQCPWWIKHRWAW
ncbi:MAG TPA: hypothetical protein VMU04_23170 [Candidatus Acidoferrum sp.]|nr:hypothetical protein [Candidatus Acidoferrum sp.]